jgi:pimeloyl-ACP methyl ester carboxylesterase
MHPQPSLGTDTVEQPKCMNKLLVTVAPILSVVAILLATQHQTFSRLNAGGPTLRMLIAGDGNSTVVFEGGAGSPLEAWTRVQPEVGKFARTISYDRAGNGLSTKGATPRDGRHIAVELHAALHNAHVPPPYILVGHSLGGPYIRIFAARYPEEVAGLVLIDPTQEESIAWNKARKAQPAEHKFRPEDEVDCVPMTFDQARENSVPTNVPVFLITGLGPREIPGFLTKELKAEVLEDREVLYKAKLKFHEEWVKKFPKGHLIITENSGHGVPFEEPELIINVIREAVKEAGSSHGPPTIPR